MVKSCASDIKLSSQEVRTIACIAKVARMIDAFFDAEVCNPFLINPNNNEKYINPKSDLHVVSAQALYPELQQVDPWDLIKESKKDLGGWNRRQRGKICGFTKYIMVN